MQPKTPPKLILVFNAKKTLVAIAGSMYEASKLTGIGAGNISRVCSGALMSSGQMYFRTIDPTIEIELNDINQLKVDEYDQMCGIERRTYDTQNMNRKKWTYSKNSKSKES